MGAVRNLVQFYEESFEEVKNLRERVLRSKDSDNYPMIAVGNKCDLRIDGDEINGYGGRSGSDVNMDDVYEWCQEHQIPYIETSAKKGKNVNFMFRHAVNEYIAHWKR